MNEEKINKNCKYCRSVMLDREEAYEMSRKVINETHLSEFERQFNQGNYLPEKYELICYNIKCSGRKGSDMRIVYNIKTDRWRLI